MEDNKGANPGWLLVWGGAIGAILIGTQVKSLLGVRYIGDFSDRGVSGVTKISDELYSLMWAVAAGAVGLGGSLISKKSSD